jgi:hypothetical protein
MTISMPRWPTIIFSCALEKPTFPLDRKRALAAGWLLGSLGYGIRSARLRRVPSTALVIGPAPKKMANGSPEAGARRLTTCVVHGGEAEGTV